MHTHKLHTDAHTHTYTGSWHTSSRLGGKLFVLVSLSHSSLSLSLSLSLYVFPELAGARALSLSLSPSLPLSLFLTLLLTLFLTLFLSQIHTLNSLSLSHSLSPAHSLSRARSLSRALSLTYAHAHTQTHTHMQGGNNGRLHLRTTEFLDLSVGGGAGGWRRGPDMLFRRYAPAAAACETLMILDSTATH